MKIFYGIERFERLQSIRFLLVLMVFFGHFFSEYNNSQFGASAVSFFFILSGFSMSIGYYNKVMLDDFCFRSYISKRIRKVYPLNISCIILFVLFMLFIDFINQDFDPIRYGFIVIDALLLQSWIPFQWSYFSGNAVSWFLCDIMFCYLVFPFVIKILHRRIWIVLLMIIAYLTIIQYVPDPYIHGIIYINPLFRLLDFSLGITLYLLIINKPIFIKRNHLLYLFEIFAVSLFVISLFAFPYIDDRYRLVSLFWIPSMVLIYGVVIGDILGGGMLSVLKNKVLCYLGSLSFPFYMLHYIVIKCFFTFFLIESAVLKDIGAVICIFFTLLLAQFYTSMLEPVWSKFLKNDIFK